ncbi:MAG: DUF4124 domain-containing protein [Rhodocyclaceae bacterium]|nr:DUF4124 domain-containing protein [Rhodocyclaceae bacterium]
MRKFIRWMAGALLALAAVGATAQVYKCKGADGRTVFSDAPCPAGAQATVVDSRPAAGHAGAAYGQPDPATARALRQQEYERRLEAAGDQQVRVQRAANEPYRQIAADAQRARCSDYQAQLDYFNERMRAGARADMYNYYKAQAASYGGRIDRECR